MIGARLASTFVDVRGTRSAAPSSNARAREAVHPILARAVIGAGLGSTLVNVRGARSAAPPSIARAREAVQPVLARAVI